MVMVMMMMMMMMMIMIMTTTTRKSLVYVINYVWVLSVPRSQFLFSDMKLLSTHISSATFVSVAFIPARKNSLLL